MPVKSPSVVVNIVGCVLNKLAIKRRYLSSLAKRSILIEHLYVVMQGVNKEAWGTIVVQLNCKSDL